MSPINGEDRWPKDTTNPILPLIYKVGLERPKKSRREHDEETRPTKLRRKNTKKMYEFNIDTTLELAKSDLWQLLDLKF